MLIVSNLFDVANWGYRRFAWFFTVIFLVIFFFIFQLAIWIILLLLALLYIALGTIYAIFEFGVKQFYKEATFTFTSVKQVFEDYKLGRSIRKHDENEAY